MVKIPRQGTQPPPVTIVVDAPMASMATLTVTIQQTNEGQKLPAHANRQATLHALSGNSAPIYIGDSTVSANAFPLNPGASEETHVDDLSKIWIFGQQGDSLSIEVEWGVGEL